MNVRSRIVLATLAAGGLLCGFVQPAGAVTGTLHCTFGSSTVNCQLRSVGIRVDIDGEMWRLNGVPQPQFDYDAGATFACTPGSTVIVSVQYASGPTTTSSTGLSGTCS
jgi:hypothetical protein